MKLSAVKIGARLETAGAGVSAVFSRLPFLWYGIGALVVGLLLARWTWLLFAPHTLSVLPPKPEASGEAAAALFGVAAASGVMEATNSVMPNVRLIGVFTGKQAFAVLRLDEKKQLGVALGEEVSKGVKLVEVAADHVLLELNGARQRVNLDNKFSDSKGMVVERPLPPPSAVAPNAEQAMAEWNQARHEMQQELMSNARR
jgi:general secretion pathway protein C